MMVFDKNEYTIVELTTEKRIFYGNRQLNWNSNDKKYYSFIFYCSETLASQRKQLLKKSVWCQKVSISKAAWAVNRLLKATLIAFQKLLTPNRICTSSNIYKILKLRMLSTAIKPTGFGIVAVEIPNWWN